MRKVYGFLSVLCVIVGVLVMILGMSLDWSLFPSRIGTWIAWTVGFWLFIVVGGLSFCVLWMRANDAHDMSSYKETAADAGDGAERVIGLSIKELARNERQELKREAELLASKKAKESSDIETT